MYVYHLEGIVLFCFVLFCFVLFCFVLFLVQVERDELHASNQQLRDQIALEEEKRTVGEQTLSNVQTSLQQLEKSRKQQQRQLAQMKTGIC